MFPDDDACLAHLFRCVSAMTLNARAAARSAICRSCRRSLPIPATVASTFIPCRARSLSLAHASAEVVLRHVPVHDDPPRRSRQGTAAAVSVNYKTAWRMGHEIRKHLGSVDGDAKLSGHVEADEAYLGRPHEAHQGPQGASSPTR